MIAPAVLEAASKNQQKKKGRSPAFHPQFLLIMAGYMNKHNRTKRQQQDCLYALRGAKALRKGDGWDPKFSWLIEDESAGKKGTQRTSILAELARFRDPERIRSLARELCRTRPRTKVAVARLRRMRLHRAELVGVVAALAAKIDKTIGDYIDSRADAVKQEILDALDLVRDAYERFT